YPARNFKNAPIALKEYYNRYLAAAAADKLYNDDNDNNRATITAAPLRTRCKDIRTFSRKKGEFSAFLTNLKDKIRTNKATFRDKEDRIGFLFRSLEGKAYKILETRLLTKTKDDSLSYEDFCGYVKDSAIKRLDAELVLPNDLPALAKYSLSILLPKTPLLNRQIDLAV
ncbi:hypothetical protein L249_4880, partial [Ophiocordyceps polyrhachis-furcata BCC 54312]